MKEVVRLRSGLVLIMALSLLSVSSNNVLCQGQSGTKQEMKQLNKEANKTSAKAEEAADQLGRK